MPDTVIKGVGRTRAGFGWTGCVHTPHLHESAFIAAPTIATTKYKQQTGLRRNSLPRRPWMVLRRGRPPHDTTRKEPSRGEKQTPEPICWFSISKISGTNTLVTAACCATASLLISIRVQLSTGTSRSTGCRCSMAFHGNLTRHDHRIRVHLHSEP